jgi:hypothetical protein
MSIYKFSAATRGVSSSYNNHPSTPTGLSLTVVPMREVPHFSEQKSCAVGRQTPSYILCQEKAHQDSLSLSLSLQLSTFACCQFWQAVSSSAWRPWCAGSVAMAIWSRQVVHPQLRRGSIRAVVVKDPIAFVAFSLESSM